MKLGEDQDKKKEVKKRIKAAEKEWTRWERRGAGGVGWGDWTRRQQNKSTGDRNAQLSSDPEARIGAHVAGMRICPALISCLAQFALSLCLKSKKKKKERKKEE